MSVQHRSLTKKTVQHRSLPKKTSLYWISQYVAVSAKPKIISLNGVSDKVFILHVSCVYLPAAIHAVNGIPPQETFAKGNKLVHYRLRHRYSGAFRRLPNDKSPQL